MKKTVHSPEFKAKVAFEAAKGGATINEIAAKYKIYPAQVSQWKKELLENLSSLFQKGGKKKEENREEQEAVLYEQIGRLKVEVDWLKIKSEEILKL